MIWLAKFHAISFAFFDQYEVNRKHFCPLSQIDIFKGGIDQAKKDFPLLFWELGDYLKVEKKQATTFQARANHSHQALFKSLDSKYPGKNYSQLLEDIVEKHGSFRTLAYKIKEKEQFKLRTLCHGDPWFNNMMFKYDGPYLWSSVLYDLQLCFHGAAALDIVYFLSVSAVGEIRQKHNEEILTLYYKTLTRTLSRLRAKLEYSYDDLGSSELSL